VLPKQFEEEKCQRRNKSLYKKVPAKIATNVINPASLDGFKPRAPPPEGLLVAEGVGTDPVDEGPCEDETPVDDERLAPVALALKAANVWSLVGLTAKTMPARQ